MSDKDYKDMSQEELFEELVPVEGKSNTVAGEILRVYNRIAYRYFNDGDHIGIGYGNETCNAPARFLLEGSFSKYLSRETHNILNNMWGNEDEDNYKYNLNRLEDEIMKSLIDNEELFTLENKEDMWDYYSKEDENYYEEDDDDDWYY